MSDLSLSSHWIDWYLLALQAYHLKVIGVIAFSDTTFRIKCAEMDVVLKKVRFEQIENIEQVASLRLPYFEQIILNGRRKAVTTFGNEHFYLVLYLPNKYYDGKLSEKAVSRLLANLHNQSFHVIEVASGYFEKWNLMFQEKLALTIQMDNAYFRHVISSFYKSPSEWLWCMSLDIGNAYYRRFQRHIAIFQELTKDKNSLRETINWGHFGEENIDYNHQILMGMHNVNWSSPVFDLFDWVDRSTGINLLENLRQYFGYFRLQIYEMHWLMCLLYDMPPLTFAGNEFENVTVLMKRKKRLTLLSALEDLLGIKEDTNGINQMG